MANDRDLKQLLSGDSAIDDPEVRRLRIFFSSCMAQDATKEKAASKTLASILSGIEGIKTREQFMSGWLDLQGRGVNAFFSYTADPDPSEKSRFRGAILQGTLGQRRLAYSQTDSAADTARLLYRKHIARMFELTGLTFATAERDADAVLRIETKLASASLPYFDQFDSTISEHPFKPGDLQTLAPQLAWNRYFNMVGQPPERAVNIASPAYLRSVDSLIAETPLEELRAFLRWQFLIAFAPALPASAAHEQQRFEAPSLKPPPRFESCRLQTLKNLGVELSRQFSQRYIGPTARSEATAVAERVRAQVVDSIAAFTWLSPTARASTEERLKMIELKVAYPQLWPEAGSYPLSKHAYLQNMIEAKAYEQHRIWARAHASRDRQSWEATVYPNEAPGMAAARLVIPNGFPDQTTNSIILTAASIQRPLFDATAPPEIRYGTFGFLVGHELGHVLENHDYDALGEPKQTWTPADIEAHEKQGSCMIEQGNRYVAFEGIHLDGKKTAGENFGDFSGIYYAYSSMARELGAHLSEKGDDGFTPAQRFFIAYAQHWCSAERPETMRENLRDDGHAPSRYRTNAPLANMPAFAHAFSCAAASPMARPASTRCSFWGLAFPGR